MTPEMQAYLEALDAYVDARIVAHKRKKYLSNESGVVFDTGQGEAYKEAQQQVKQAKFAMRQRLEGLLSGK